MGDLVRLVISRIRDFTPVGISTLAEACYARGLILRDVVTMMSARICNSVICLLESQAYLLNG